MPFPRSSSPTGRRSQRDRAHASQTSARTPVAKGVLVLCAEVDESSLRPASRNPTPGDLTLAQLWAERDTLREEVEYLKEQLHGLSAYHAHVLKEERGQVLEELARLASEQAMMRKDLHRRMYTGATSTWSACAPLTAGGPLTTTSDWGGTDTR